MRFIVSLLLSFFLVGSASARVVTEVVAYSHNGTGLKGYLAYDDAIQGKRPGVLVVHEWWGLNDFVKQRADKLAESGFVALAVDMYGEGKFTQNPEEPRRLATHVRTTPLMRERAKRG